MKDIYSISKGDFNRIIGEIEAKKPIAYGKSRVSKSIKNTYFMHPKSGCMPGQKELFTTVSTSQASGNSSILENAVSRAFKRGNYLNLKKPIGSKSQYSYLDSFTFKEYSPYDDESLKIAIIASYKQVYGNFIPMESERPIDSERRLRNGDIAIRDFIRVIAKSQFYRANYFEKNNQQKFVELSFIHILGRPVLSNQELVQSVELIFKEGFYSYIDSLIDSLEYTEIFGEDVVPYQRCWNSPCGSKTSSFLKTARLNKGGAASHNCI